MSVEFRHMGCAGWTLCAMGLVAGQAQTAAVAAEVQDDSRKLTMEERLQQQDQRIRELEARLRQLESASMAGQAPAAEAEPQAKAALAESQPKAAAADQQPQAVAPATEAPPPQLVGDLFGSHQVLAGKELTSEEFPGSWPMFGTDMRMRVGGYVKADFVADLDGTLDPTQFLMSTIPVEGTPEYANDGYVSFFAKDSRFNLDVRRVTPGAPPLRAFLEGDFFSTDNQFRLRHAYMTVGDWVIGQTWTTLSLLESLPFMIDFAAGDALFGGRAAQVRYQHKLNDRWKMMAAVEELSYLGIQNPNDFAGKATRQLPQFALRADYNWGTGMLLMGSSVAQLHWDGGAYGPSDSAIQYDFVVGGRQNVGSDGYVTWNVSYGMGSGENIMAFAGSEANAVLDSEGKLDTFPAFALVLGMGYNWTDKWSSNFSYAYGWLDPPESRDPGSLKRGGIGHVNLIWKPVKQFSTGIEFMSGAARTQDDALGRAQRIQMMGKFDF